MRRAILITLSVLIMLLAWGGWACYREFHVSPEIRVSVSAVDGPIESLRIGADLVVDEGLLFAAGELVSRPVKLVATYQGVPYASELSVDASGGLKGWIAEVGSLHSLGGAAWTFRDAVYEVEGVFRFSLTLHPPQEDRAMLVWNPGGHGTWAESVFESVPANETFEHRGSTGRFEGRLPAGVCLEAHPQSRRGLKIGGATSLEVQVKLEGQWSTVGEEGLEIEELPDVVSLRIGRDGEVDLHVGKHLSPRGVEFWISN